MDQLKNEIEKHIHSSHLVQTSQDVFVPTLAGLILLAIASHIFGHAHCMAPACAPVLHHEEGVGPAAGHHVSLHCMPPGQLVFRHSKAILTVMMTICIVLVVDKVQPLICLEGEVQHVKIKWFTRTICEHELACTLFSSVDFPKGFAQRFAHHTCRTRSCHPTACWGSIHTIWVGVINPWLQFFDAMSKQMLSSSKPGVGFQTKCYLVIQQMMTSSTT